MGACVVLLRTAPVLSPSGQCWAKAAPAVQLGLGGRLGSGQQWMPWIALQDEVALIDFLLHHSSAAASSTPARRGWQRNAEFTQALALRPAPPSHLARAGVGAAAGAGRDVGLAVGRPSAYNRAAALKRRALCFAIPELGAALAQVA